MEFKRKKKILLKLIYDFSKEKFSFHLLLETKNSETQKLEYKNK